MNQLIKVGNQEGTLVVSSREVSENFDKRHPDVIRAIENLLEETLTQNCTDLFMPSKYKDSYGREQKEYLLTRDGFSLLAMGFTGQKALEWKLKYIEAFNKMEQILKKPLSNQEMLRIQLGMIDGLDERVDKLENTMTIDYGQQQVLKDLVNRVVVEWLGGKTSPAYKEISKIVFSEINRDFQRYFNVNSRNNTPKLKLNEAVEYIKNWEPCSNTKLMIKQCNSQLSFV